MKRRMRLVCVASECVYSKELALAWITNCSAIAEMACEEKKERTMEVASRWVFLVELFEDDEEDEDEEEEEEEDDEVEKDEEEGEELLSPSECICNAAESNAYRGIWGIIWLKHLFCWSGASCLSSLHIESDERRGELTKEDDEGDEEEGEDNAADNGEADEDESVWLILFCESKICCFFCNCCDARCE